MATTKTDPKLALTANGAKKSKLYEGLTREQLIQAYRLMYTSRRIDDREILLKRQQKIYFQMSGAGHEAHRRRRRSGAEAGLRLVLSLLSRPRALPGAGGQALRDVPAGRWCGRRSQFRRAADALALELSRAEHRDAVVADGLADSAGRRLRRGGRYFARHPKAAEVPAPVRTDYRQFKNVSFQGDEVTYVSLGDGTSSEGEFWEAMNAAALGKLPVIFCVEDNGYAISVPVEVQTAGGSISRLVSGFPNFHFEEVDGTDPVASYAAFRARLRVLPRGTRPGVRACARDSSVLALAVG